MSADGQGIKRCRKIAEIFNRLSTVHERYRQTDRLTDGRQQIANVNASNSRSLKSNIFFAILFLLYIDLRHRNCIHVMCMPFVYVSCIDDTDNEIK